ncbi:hypothetical protein PYW07_012529 [Mythimna separata]|uniref:Uncharacterized protein n=1 Tax=Mythimna separata TaxID=271217 RepID=A0AAD7Y8J3_MYTSE|nr:hypothetical protein PYW07_012529 [Mythimna separata]
MSDDDDESFRAAIDAELSKKEEELRCLEELRVGIGFAPRNSLMRTPPGGFQRASGSISPIREESPAKEVTPLGGKRPLSSPQESQGRPTRSRLGARSGDIPPISGILAAAAVPGQHGVMGVDSPPRGAQPEASSTPNKGGLAALDKSDLIDQVYQAVKGISGVANATNKLNMADKGLIAGYSQDILAVVASLTVRMAELENVLIAKELRVATLELQQASGTPAPTGTTSTTGMDGTRKADYAAILKLPNGKPRVAVEQRGPAVLFYPNSEGIKSSDATLKELRDKVQPGQSGIQVEGVRRVGNAGVVVQTASQTAAQKLKAAAPPTLRSADPRSRRPLVALRNLSGNPKAEEVLEDPHRVNLAEDPAWPIDRVRKEAGFAFKKGRRGGRTTTVVYEVSAALRDKLVGLG